MPNQGTESQFEETTIDRLLVLLDALLPKLLSGELRVSAVMRKLEAQT